MITKKQTHANIRDIWDLTENTLEEAATMRLRSSLMITIDEHIKAKRWTQAEAARRLGVSPPRMSDLQLGKIDLFDIEALVSLATRAGLEVEIRVTR